MRRSWQPRLFSPEARESEPQDFEEKKEKIVKKEVKERKIKKVAKLEPDLEEKEYREKLIEEIAAEAKVKTDTIYIDIPTLPSVPYSHSVDLPAYEIPMFMREGTKRKKKEVNIRRVSRIFESLMGMMYIFRVYSIAKNREKVKKAAEKIFGQQSIEKQISF